jgi:hypothetical protein
VGYVPGGDIEVIIQDAILGPVFYLIKIESSGDLKIKRNVTSCISCHRNSNSENIIGMHVISVFPDENGQLLLALGTATVTPATPLSKRWGGYYVTGRSSLPHLGNRAYVENQIAAPEVSELKDVREMINTTQYLRSTSDIVALLILEHQCRMNNLLNAAAMRYRRAYFLSKTISSQENPDFSSAGQVADDMADKIIEGIFLKTKPIQEQIFKGVKSFKILLSLDFPKQNQESR